jgi:transcriptional regulator with PAS, ATPase and Fis domain
MSSTMQVNLLRALQEGEFKPLGGNEYKPFDVRIISATNKDLKHQVKTGLFREDLFFRLSAFPILLPPLRERKDDIPLLIRHIMAKSAKKFQNTVHKMNPKAMLLLMEYSFPGNVRELENIIERAMAMVDDGDRIEPHHLPRDIRHIGVLDGLLPEQSGTLKEMVTALEKTILLTTLKKKNWIKAQAAQELGLSRLGLRKKMQRYNITPE